jgi:hypothetical protein
VILDIVLTPHRNGVRAAVIDKYVSPCGREARQVVHDEGGILRHAAILVISP